MTSLKVNSDQKFEEGTTAIIAFPGDKFTNKLFIKSLAVFTLGSEEAVFVMDEYGFKKVAKVKTGKTINGFTERKSGLKEGEQVAME